MGAIYPARWTRGQILDQGLEKAGNTSIRALGRDKLNRILEDIYARWEWTFLYTAVDVVVPTDGVFDLPVDFLKTFDDFALRVLPSSGLTDRLFTIRETDIHTLRIYDDGVTVSNLPRAWAVDASTRTGVAAPPPIQNVPCQLRYKFLPADYPIAGSAPVAGTGTLTSSGVNVTGVGTTFTTQLAVGSVLLVGTQSLTIATIVDDTHLTTTAPAAPALAGASFRWSIPYDLDVPLFPFGQVLADAIYVWALEYDENPMSISAKQLYLASFDEVRNAAIPSKPVPRTVDLDPDVFSQRTFIPEDWWHAHRHWWWEP